MNAENNITEKDVLQGITSIMTFPERGPWGDKSYPGNLSGHVVKSILEYLLEFNKCNPFLFTDPCEGSCTSRHVAAGYPNVAYHGFDLRTGFDILRDSIAESASAAQDFILFHPPYHNMHQYSGIVWDKDSPHPADLSRCASYGEFLTRIREALSNIYDSLKQDGTYAIVVGDMRKNGEYYAIGRDVQAMAPGRLTNVIIKAQSNMRSRWKRYTVDKKPFIPIVHEYIFLFERSRSVFGILDAAISVNNHLTLLNRSSWRSVVTYALRHFGNKATLQDLYSYLSENAKGNLAKNPVNWQAKIRQIVQIIAEPRGRGIWELKTG